MFVIADSTSRGPSLEERVVQLEREAAEYMTERRVYAAIAVKHEILVRKLRMRQALCGLRGKISQDYRPDEEWSDVKNLSLTQAWEGAEPVQRTFVLNKWLNGSGHNLYLFIQALRNLLQECNEIAHPFGREDATGSARRKSAI